MAGLSAGGKRMPCFTAATGGASVPEMRALIALLRHALLAAVLAIAAAPIARAQTSPDETAQAAYDAYAARNYVEAERLARELEAAPGSDARADDRRFYARQLLGNAILRQRRCPEALAVSDQNIRTYAERSDAWALAFSATFQCEQYPRAAEALATLARMSPERLSYFTDHAITVTAQWSNDPALLGYLVHGGWTPHDRTTDLSNVRLTLIAALLARNDLAEAQQIAQGLVLNTSTDLGALVLLFSDRRFERVIAADSDTFNFEEILAWQLNNARAAAAAEPNRAMAVHTFAEALFDHGRYDEALALVDDALARPDDFPDINEGRPWLLDTRASLLEAKGDVSAAMEALRAGAETQEGEQPNVSQRLNYASLLVDYDRPAEALAQLEGFDPVNASGYGRMVMLRVLVCAHAALGDEANMRARLAQAMATQESSLRQIYAMALCTNDLDLAARTLIRRLDHPTERRGIIVGLQDYLPDPSPETESSRIREQRASEVRERRDVARALRRAANVRSFPIRQP